MRRTTRFVLAGLCAAVALAAGTSLVVLRLGRPLWYSDGRALTRADDLADRPMQVFDTPLPEVELPGPVRGRAARLQDGRIVYGRARSDQRTDLVSFDPRHPEVEPVALSINSDGHDLAPCIAPDGDLLFASDRSGGAGGFDIWRAHALGDGRFAPPIHVPETVNGPADEVDPALSPDGVTLVFARRLPEERAASLFVARLDRDGAAHALWPTDSSDAIARLELVIDREPVFTPDGAWLYFVRERAARGMRLFGTPFHDGAFGGPLEENVLGGSGRFSSPIPDGFDVHLLTAGAQPLLHRATARLLWPYWEGQLALERLLLWVLCIALLLLALLLLGARWRALDIVTWCLLISLVVHLLLWWLFHGVLMAEPELPMPSDGDRIALTMLEGDAEAQESAGGAGAAEQAMRAERPDRAASIAAVAPSSELAQRSDSSAPSAVSADLARAEPTEGERAASERAMQDALPVFAPNSGADALPASDLTAQASAQDTARAADQSERAATATEAVVVTAPSSRALPVSSGGGAAAPSGSASELPRAEPTAARGAAPLGALADAVQVVTPDSRGAATLPALAASSEGHAAQPREAFVGEAARPTAASADASSAREVVHAPGSALGAPSVTESSAASMSTPVARALPSGAARPMPGTAMRDGPATAAAPASAARAEAILASATPSLTGLEAHPIEASATRGSATPTPASGGSAAPGSALPAASLPNSSSAGTGFEASARPVPTAPRRMGPVAGLHDTLRSESPAQGVPSNAASRSSGASPSLTPLGPRALVAELVRPGSGASRGAALVATAPASSVPAAPRGAEQPSATASARPDLAALYGNRFGPRKAQAIERFGGSVETERAVQSGLAYLASIQDPRGHWGNKDHEMQKYGEVWVGKTALCTLAFLGAGHTPRSNTRYSDNVRRALDALLDAQGEEYAHFGDTSSYSHGIATYALAECLAITGDERLRDPLARAVAWILRNQDHSRDRRNRGGWGYFSATRRPEDGYARTSTTVWQVMALESAKISGIEVPDGALDDARRFLRGMFDQRLGAFLYNKDQSRLSSSWPTLPASTPAAVFCLLLLGDDADDERIQAGLRFTLQRRPKAWREASQDAFVLRAEGHPYFWYCGSLACFLAGGDAWQQWNEALKQVFLPAQNRDGSFTPIGAYAEYADDRPEHAAFTTALAVLSLEVYYRYTTPLLEGR